MLASEAVEKFQAGWVEHRLATARLIILVVMVQSNLEHAGCVMTSPCRQRARSLWMWHRLCDPRKRLPISSHRIATGKIGITSGDDMSGAT